MKIRKSTLLVATLAMVLGIGSSAVAQVAEEPAAPPTYTLSEDGLNLVINGETEVPCEQIYRDEQVELAQTGVYPTQVSEQARACEELGVVSYFPAPYFYDADGFLYTLDPVGDRYISDFDEAAGVYYIYDLVSGAFYAYDPASGTYV